MNVRQLWVSPSKQFITTLILSSLVSEVLFGYGAWHSHSLLFDYLTWNLLLAWLPLIFAARLTKVLKNKLWSSWEALGLSILWLIFLPNSFYMISDFIHLQDISQYNAVYDAIMLTSFVYTAVIMGFSSLFLVHLHIKRRATTRVSSGIVAFILFISSIAVYFGRDLRWNSWDLLTNPGGLSYDFYYRIDHLTSYPEMSVTIVALFVLLCVMYNLLWRSAHILQTWHYLESKNL